MKRYCKPLLAIRKDEPHYKNIQSMPKCSLTVSHIMGDLVLITGLSFDTEAHCTFKNPNAEGKHYRRVRENHEVSRYY